MASNLLSGVAPESAVWSEDFRMVLWSVPGTDIIRLETVSVSVTRGVFRRPARGRALYIPFDSGSRGAKGLGVGKGEGAIRRSGGDSVGRGTVRLASFWPSMGPISVLALLRARR